tara:strand:+ start:557 stop:754 length:198 start_codon:yes stop_codon:yes gene_type:complete
MILTREELRLIKKILTNHVDNNLQGSFNMISDKDTNVDIIDETLNELKVGRQLLSRIDNKLGVKS